MADGSIRIDIVGDDKDLQRKVKEIEKLEKQKKTIEVKIDLHDADYGVLTSELDNLRYALAKLNREKDKLSDEKARMGAFAPSTMDDALLDIESKIQRQELAITKKEGALSKLLTKYDAEISKLIDINSKLEISRTEADQIQLKNLETSSAKVGKDLSGIKKSLGKTIMKVGKWALAVFGVRTAYMAIRRAMSTLTQYNEQLKTDLQYISFSLAKTLEPVIVGIVNLVMQALQWINSILYALFGINLFANSTAKAFQAGQGATGGMVKDAKELRKQLAGFDEMIRLEAGVSDVGGGGAGGGGLAPSIDLSKPLENPFEKIKQWWIKFKEWLDPDIAEFMDGMVESIMLKWEGLKLFFGGLWKVIKGIFTGDVDLIVEGFEDMGDGFKTAMEGMELEAQTWSKLIEKMWETLWEAIKKWAKKKWEEMKTKLKDWWEDIKTMSWEEVDEASDGIADRLIKAMFGLFGGLAVKLKKWLREKKEDFKNWAKDSWKGIQNAFSGVGTFFGNMWNVIKQKFTNIGQKIGESVGNAFKRAINSVISTVERILNAPVNIVNSLASALNKLPGVSIGYMSNYSIPRLAKGGILNKPGTGVNVGGAIAGEAGREFYTPLNNEQVLAEVGSAIGKHIKVYTTSITQLNGRTLAKEMKVTENEENFAYNGGFR